MRIFVPQPIPERAVERLEALGDLTVFPHVDRAINREELLGAVVDKEILFAIGDVEYDREVLEAAAALRMIGAMQSSSRLVDVDRATARGIPVALLQRDTTAATTAEYTMALLLATARRIPEAERYLREGRWRQRQSMAMIGTRVAGKTLGIAGAGAIGQEVARRARGFDLDVIYTKRTRLDEARETELGIRYRTLEQVFAEADFVVITVALTPETTGLVDARVLGLMKPDAILVNTSRGKVLDEDALLDCLRRGAIRGAGLDVFQHEVTSPVRIGPREELLDLPNVVATPHIGSAALETREEMAMQVVDNIEAFLRGERPPGLCNPEAYEVAAAPRSSAG